MTTDKFDLHEIDYSVQGWDVIMASDMEQIDAAIPSRIIVTLGETVAKYEALWMDESDSLSRWFLAQADGTKQPTFGLAVEAGDESDEIRIWTIGEVTNPAWSWTPGGKIYLDPSTPGALTQVDPILNRNIVGIALTETTIFITLTDQGLPVDPDEKVQDLVCADVVTIDWSLGSTARMTFDRAAVEFQFTGGYDGQRCVLILKQAGGGATIDFGSAGETDVRDSDDLASPPTLSGAGKTDYLGYIYNADAGWYDFVSINKGFI